MCYTKYFQFYYTIEKYYIILKWINKLPRKLLKMLTALTIEKEENMLFYYRTSSLDARFPKLVMRNSRLLIVKSHCEILRIYFCFNSTCYSHLNSLLNLWRICVILIQKIFFLKYIMLHLLLCSIVIWKLADSYSVSNFILI